MISKRRNLQIRIEQLRKRTTIQTNKIILTKCLYAWKQQKEQNKQQLTQPKETQQIVLYKPPKENIQNRTQHIRKMETHNDTTTYT